ncbi:MAG: hypothetical protein COA79_12090 [Planctomycetota bacterium]|nr:MAG: hypothetical protein COA79_12090 [Planctomycetota bacterium]
MSDKYKDIKNSFKNLTDRFKSDEAKELYQKAQDKSEAIFNGAKERLKNVGDKISELNPTEIKSILKNVIKGKIQIPTRSIKERLEQEIQTRKKSIDKIEINFHEDYISSTFDTAGLVPISGTIKISIHKIVINQYQQTISFKTEAPLEIDKDSIPEELLNNLSAIIGMAILEPDQLLNFIPPAFKPLTKEGEIFEFDLSQIQECNNWFNKKIMEKRLVEYIEIKKIEISEDFITLTPSFAKTDNNIYLE